MWPVKTSVWSVSGLREIHRFERALRHAAKQNILFSSFSKNFLIIPYPYGKRKGNYGLSCRSSRIFTFLSLPFPTFFCVFLSHRSFRFRCLSRAARLEIQGFSEKYYPTVWRFFQKPKARPFISKARCHTFVPAR